MEYPMISGVEGTGGAIMKKYGNKHFPTIHLVAPDKKIVEKEIEMSYKPSELEALVAKYVVPTAVENQKLPVQSRKRVKVIGGAKNHLRISVDQHDIYTITVYTLNGKEIFRMHEGIGLHAGTHSVFFDHHFADHGIFIVKIEAASFSCKEKVIF